MDDIPQLVFSSSDFVPNSAGIWHRGTLLAGQPVYHWEVTLASSQIGTLREQLAIAQLASENPWQYGDPADAMRAARRTILDHAKRRAL